VEDPWGYVDNVPVIGTSTGTPMASPKESDNPMFMEEETAPVPTAEAENRVEIPVTVNPKGTLTFIRLASIIPETRV
jgi:hypothetical protein